ncbi:MAG: VOC family protein [Defluviitaleaceae bacterium]|nr:VOC family protein [Defluviitaleaceae bacterium]
MKIRPYLTFNGQCVEAIELYTAAFKAETLECQLFSEMPEIPGYEVPEEYKCRVLQARLKIGEEFIRLSDCGYAPGFVLNQSETEQISLAVEASEADIRHAFGLLAQGGRVAMHPTATFYSPCAAVVFDKFGVMWNLMAV